MSNSIKKEHILQRISDYDILNHFLAPYHDKGPLKKNQQISNPFLGEPQKTPSFHLFNIDGNWFYKDSKTGHSGDSFKLVMELKNCTFNKATEIIIREMNIMVENKKEVTQCNLGFTINHFESWNENHLKYWIPFGINQDILDQFGVNPVKSFGYLSSKKPPFTSSTKEPIFSYKAKGAYKIYRPLTTDKKFKFLWLGKKPKDFVFGYSQLPEKASRVYITGGEKDVMTLASQGLNAITLNSETIMPTIDLIEDLKNRFDEVIVFYDIDSTGMESSKAVCQKFGLKRFLLPQELLEKGIKDVSEYIKQGHLLSNPKCKVEGLGKEISQQLRQVLKTRDVIRKNKKVKITFSKPILSQNNSPILYPRTINIIQGKSGVHKSRLAETLCSAFIRSEFCTSELLEFNVNIETPTKVCYVDTERNTTEQLPYSNQQILTKAGFNIYDEPEHFDCISLLTVNRNMRFSTLEEYLEKVRTNYNNHILVILDVITDCIKDFNRPEDSMQLIDLMNKLIDKYNVTFLCLIHENPGSIEKARGHLGTELMNKSSTVMQVGTVNGKNNQPSDLFCIKFLKCRNSKKHEPIYIKYDQEEKGLVLADSNEVESVMDSRSAKASLKDIVELLPSYLKTPKYQEDLIDYFTNEFNCSSKTIKNRIDEIINRMKTIMNKDKVSCYLRKARAGKRNIFSLEPIAAKETLET